MAFVKTFRLDSLTITTIVHTAKYRIAMKRFFFLLCLLALSLNSGEARQTVQRKGLTLPGRRTKVGSKSAAKNVPKGGNASMTAMIFNLVNNVAGEQSTRMPAFPVTEFNLSNFGA